MIDGSVARWLLEHTNLGPCPRRHAHAAVQATASSAPTAAANTGDTSRHVADGATIGSADADESGGDGYCCVGFLTDGGGYTAELIAREQGHAELADWLAARRAALLAAALPASGCALAAARCRPTTVGEVALAGEAAAPQLVLTGPLGKLEPAMAAQPSASA